MSLILSTAPHIRSKQTTQKLMMNVIISLLPCAAAGILFFGWRAAMVLAISTFSAVLAEYLWHIITKRPAKISDCSAAVTGLLLGLCITPNAPWWMPMIGSFFAIIIVKQLFGGIGDNFLNPALTARAVLLASWPAKMTIHLSPVDAVASATPLYTGNAEWTDLLFGTVPGAIGETCKIAILIGFAYLLITRTITWRIPVCTMISTFVMSALLGMNPIQSVLSGGILFGAVFMATDYTTSPTKPAAQMIYAAGIGVMTVLIRKFGAYPEGVTYAILLMNIAAPLLDRAVPSRIYGHLKKEKKVKQNG